MGFMDAPDTTLPAIHPGTPPNVTVSFILHIVRETPKAYLVHRTDVLSRDVWLPRSHVHKPGRTFFLRDMDSGHTHPMTTADMVQRFGDVLTGLVSAAPDHWVLIDESPLAEEVWEPLPTPQPVTVSVRAINMELFAKRDEHAA